MANKQGFDLASVLGSVSKLGTEQIVLLPLDLIDPDPENFYSLEGLDELAGNIELMGLLDPLRVRPNGERYTVVSGHRRRAAILLIRDGGSKQFADGVPCIVEYGEASGAMRKLRLIYANASTRQLSSADLSRQAEEVTRLLYELQEQGVKFPGRMRDHVAQACGVTKSKIARLHAIRSRGVEYVVEAFDQGKINESVAYELSKLDRFVQKRIYVNHVRLGYKPEALTAEYILGLDALYHKLIKIKCPKSHGPCCCPYAESLFDEAQRMTHFEGVKGNCSKGRCCMTCPDLSMCEHACLKCEEERKAMIAAEEQRRRERLDAANRNAGLALEAKKRHDEEATEIWARIRQAADAGNRDPETVLECVCECDADVEQAMHFLNGEEKDTTHLAMDLLDECALELADGLGCSLDFLLGRTDSPRLGGAAKAWETGTPKAAGWYAARTTLHGKPMHSPRCLWWNGSGWMLSAEDPYHIDKAMQVAGWIPLPEEVEA